MIKFDHSIVQSIDLEAAVVSRCRRLSKAVSCCGAFKPRQLEPYAKLSMTTGNSQEAIILEFPVGIIGNF